MDIFLSEEVLEELFKHGKYRKFTIYKQGEWYCEDDIWYCDFEFINLRDEKKYKTRAEKVKKCYIVPEFLETITEIKE